MASSASTPYVTMPFDDAAQQRHAARFGMWIFLATEVLFFGGLFVGYIEYRYEYPEAFTAASEKLNLWSGGLMTAILLAGSLLVAASDSLIESNVEGWPARRAIVWRLALTALLGIAFLGLEFSEYYKLIEEGLFPGAGFRTDEFADVEVAGRSAEMFFTLFFCMTGLHAFHMIIGISLVGGMALVTLCAERLIPWRNPLMVIGLYWHFVDIVWVFLYPLFYLVG